ncbi:quinolinate synthase A [Candidatus Kuenenia stuttgartiensis]|uniref:Quinolinate synthase n=1 Tax=Kuenenia stuttgartiensis TaxID=174633 RepID=Q1Q697_KUEST|nr:MULTISPECIES: quinolinate synthase NadA [Kuenenia]MBE7548339.1 quinolinate synthase NadA [Planctomycetia bacterium]MBZ0192018.1 quinolinate synthase NadA [Candidatus Kuenenia stuttgartiensis]MCL4728792.1 quinolinate synthase NadA [Candidatus Kuenenia stuttgartiensis]MCZ7621002.1 quinolinate synthase NadA [Candidatus Kuenenia sp.]QII13098.1 quinolinate synthase A [Candidatus Kuenenia stuttgartiensis]
MTTLIIDKIKELKKKRNAIILAHNYQRGEVQDIADYAGDSLGLSQQAAKTEAEMIVFCGVHFMAETASILCPGKLVLLPDENAGCPMANMITRKELILKKKEYPGAKVVCYVNSTAAVKAESDICCTSSNAIKIVSSFPKEQEILFVPDKSLGGYVSKQLNRPMILWEGYCPTHHRILAEHIVKAKKEHPQAKIVVHPECTPDVIELADHVASTTGIAKYCRESSAGKFIIGTEIGLLHRLKKENPQKSFFAVTPLSDCPNMKLINLEKVLWALEDLVYEVKVAEDIAQKAHSAIQKMLDLS